MGKLKVVDFKANFGDVDNYNLIVVNEDKSNFFTKKIKILKYLYVTSDTKNVNHLYLLDDNKDIVEEVSGKSHNEIVKLTNQYLISRKL